MPVLEQRYAEALAELAFEKSEIEECGRQLKTLTQAFEQDNNFHRLLTSREISLDVKKDILENSLKDKISKTVMSFLLLLVDKERAGLLPGIYSAYTEIMDRYAGVLNMTIISAFPLAQQQIDKISRKYVKMYKSVSAKVELKVDPGIIGGVKVIIGDKQIDASVSGQLESLKEVILERK